MTLVSELPGPFLEFLLSADDRRAASLSICGFMREAEFLQAGRFFAKKPSARRYRSMRWTCWVALFFRRISHCYILFFGAVLRSIKTGRSGRIVSCWPHAFRGTVGVATRYFPATFFSASLILSCQPGPDSWKYSRTSRSMRRETSSLAFGMDGCLATGSRGFVGAFLNAASAACRESMGLRIRSSAILTTL